MFVPYFNLNLRNTIHKEEILSEFSSLISSGVFVGGSSVEKFENKFSQFCGTSFCVSVGNGLDALKLILRGYRFEKGMEVLVPGHTFIATWNAVIEAGLTPIPIDIDIDSGNMDLANLHKKITKKTVAIIVVHLYGKLVNIDPIKSICSELNIKIIEDAAQAHGALYLDSRAGSLGDAAAFSFYPTKNLGALGDAGAITTNDEELVRELRLLRSYGADTNNKYLHLINGVNSRMDSIQASFLNLFLPYLETWNDKRRAIAERYITSFVKLSVCGDSFDLVNKEINDLSNVWHIFPIRVRNRDLFIKNLMVRGVQLDVHYPVPAYKHDFFGVSVECLPNSDLFCSEVVSIPLHPWLSEEEIEFIIENVSSELSMEGI